MSTSAFGNGFLGVAGAGLALSGCAIAPLTQPPADLRGGPHLSVQNGYLTRAGMPAVVAGQLRRDPLWSGPVRGHLHVIAFGADGQVLARRAVRWFGMSGRRGDRTAFYKVGLRVPRSQITRLAVSYAADDHKMSEDFRLSPARTRPISRDGAPEVTAELERGRGDEH